MDVASGKAMIAELMFQSRGLFHPIKKIQRVTDSEVPGIMEVINLAADYLCNAAFQQVKLPTRAIALSNAGRCWTNSGEPCG